MQGIESESHLFSIKNITQYFDLLFMKRSAIILLSLFSFFFSYAQEAEEFDVTLSDLTGEGFYTSVNKITMPRVFNGYRHLTHRPRRVKFPDPKIIDNLKKEIWENVPEKEIDDDIFLEVDTTRNDTIEVVVIPSKEDLPVAFGSVTPRWLTRAIESYRWQEDFIYRMMIADPMSIEYAYWDLPERPRLPEEDVSFLGYLKRVNSTEIVPEKSLPIHANGNHINWLHTFNLSLQLSQSYISGNWYQGGTSYLAFFGNFLWDVLLNQVYYPNTMFQSTVSYKLSINSTPDDQYHKYQVSQDLFQYNLKAGYKAYHNWYYSFATQFKTQFLNSYPTDSPDRAASFLSPSQLNLGIGMTYSKENQAKTLKFSGTLSPLSYNLTTCIDKKIDPTQFGIEAGKTTLSEIGSNAEINFMAKFWGNTTYTTRVFLFTDYKSIETDWENTLNFQFSKLFSTQIYAHLRYDTKVDPKVSPKWGKLMLKEILSVGLSYNFSTK